MTSGSTLGTVRRLGRIETGTIERCACRCLRSVIEPEWRNAGRSLEVSLCTHRMEGLTTKHLHVAGKRWRVSSAAVTSRRQGRPRLATVRSFAALLTLLPLAVALTGCFSVKIRPVEKTVVMDHVLNSSLDQLLEGLQRQYTVIETLNATVEITATTGGAHTGEEHQIPSFAGYIVLRKPSDLRVLLLVPVVRSRALDMVSDGKNFKLLIPPKNRAIVGPDAVTTPSANGLENLRPNIIRDALLIPPVGPDDFVALSESSRIMPSPTKKHETIEEPDYDLAILRQKKGHVLERSRVVHIGRADLRPYRQEIYDEQGRIVTRVTYDNYAKVNGTWFPMLINIVRPLDEYSLKIEVSKVVLNQKLEDDQFVLNIPEGVPVQTMK